MLRLMEDVLNGLIAGQRFTAEMKRSVPLDVRGHYPRFSRHLMLDVECDLADPKQFLIVLRGADKVLAGASSSSAEDESLRKYHQPALYWSDEHGKPRPFIIARAGESCDAATITAAALEFFSKKLPPRPFFDRWNDLPDAARPLVAALITMFGCGPTGNCRPFHPLPKRDGGPGASRSPSSPMTDLDAPQRTAAQAIRGQASAKLDAESTREIDALLSQLGL